MRGQRRLVGLPGALRTERSGGLAVLRAEGSRLRATVVLRGRHRCIALVEGAIERLREVEEPEASCRIEVG